MKILRSTVPLAVLVMLSVRAYAQGESVPRIEEVTYRVQPFLGSFYFLGYFEFFTFPFDPSNEQARERDRVFVDLEVSDADLGAREGNQLLTFLYRVNAFSVPGLGVPAPALRGTTNNKYVNANPTDTDPRDPNRVLITIQLEVPTFLGPSQQRLRGLTNYDTAWEVEIRVSNEESPDEGSFSEHRFFLFAIENELIAPSNPPPDADAGTDRTVRVGSTVRLNGSRTFDGTNLGFDTSDANVFSKDTLRFIWEWVSGPERVDPAPYDPARPFGTPYALVTLNTLTTPTNPYVYRLLVDDGVNPVPSSSSVRVFVVTSLPSNRAPTAVADVAQAPIPVGSRTVLNGNRSSDPDGDALAYRWKQTNAVGGELTEDELQDSFQPLDGRDEPVASWVPFTAGRYYFTLTVTDPEGLTNSTLVSVEVIEADGSTAAQRDPVGNAAPRSSDASEPGLEVPERMPATGCGAGLLPLALLPAVFIGARKSLR